MGCGASSPNDYDSASDDKGSDVESSRGGQSVCPTSQGALSEENRCCAGGNDNGGDEGLKGPAIHIAMRKRAVLLISNPTGPSPQQTHSPTVKKQQQGTCDITTPHSLQGSIKPVFNDSDGPPLRTSLFAAPVATPLQPRTIASSLPQSASVGSNLSSLPESQRQCVELAPPMSVNSAASIMRTNHTVPHSAHMTESTSNTNNFFESRSETGGWGMMGSTTAMVAAGGDDAKSTSSRASGLGDASMSNTLRTLSPHEPSISSVWSRPQAPPVDNVNNSNSTSRASLQFPDMSQQYTAKHQFKLATFEVPPARSLV